jgi:hypothetical protein
MSNVQLDLIVRSGICEVGNRSGDRIAELCDEFGIDLRQPLTTSPSEFVSQIWEEANKRWKLVGGAAGDLAEVLIALALSRSGIRPFVMGGESPSIPTHAVDFWVETVELGPVVISSNTVVKERWRNENLAAHVMKSAFRRGRWYVVTMRGEDAQGISRKIEDFTAKYLDGAPCALEVEFDRLVEMLSLAECIEPSREVIQGRLVV